MEIKSGFKDIDYCVHSVMADLDETSTVNYSRYLKWAIDCFHELNLYLSPVIKTVELQIEDNLTVPFPDDYINYIAIGVNINGRLWTLTRNDDIVLRRGEECPISLQEAQALSQQTDNQIISVIPYRYYFGGAFRGGQYVGEQYAFGGGWNYKGYYTEDTEKRRFQFASTVAKSKIILEYKSSGIDCDGSVQIQIPSVASIVSYIHWKRVEHNSSMPTVEKERKYGLWVKEFQKLKHYNLMFTMSEFLDNKWKTIRSVPKR